MFFSFKRQSLMVKFSAMVIGMTLVSVVVTSVTFFVFERKEERRHIVDNAQIFAQATAGDIYDAYIRSYSHPAASSFTVFGTELQTILSSNADVARVQLVAINGRLLFDSHEVDNGKKYQGPDRFINDPGLLALVTSGETTTRDLSAQAQDGAAFQVVVPVRAIEGVHTLSMVYWFSFDSLQDVEAEILGRALLVAAPLLAMGILLPLLLVPSAIKPIRRLKEAATEISHGNFDVVVTPESGDEVGALSAAFAQMVAELKKSRASLLAKIEELEKLNKLMIGRELRMVELKEQSKKTQ